ncbi:MAG: FkbM family methyltransferase [Alphaproteobacteria bacterium]|nr:FkbM family methyltransferase [Alphaproteobacteria bacterium]
MDKFSANVICGLIPGKAARHALREKLRPSRLPPKDDAAAPVTVAIVNGMSFDVVPLQIGDTDFWHIFNTKQWEPGTFEFYKKHVRPDKDVIDIGGWIGPTMLIAYSLNPRAVHVVEGDPANFQTMKINAMQNYAQDKVRMQNICVSDKTGDVVEFGLTDESHPDSSTKSMNAGGGVKVLTTDIVEYLKSKDLADTSIVKIDIEGAEQLCARGLAYMSEFPGLNVLLSLHPPFWEDKGGVVNKLMPEFKKFDIFNEEGKPLELSELQDMMLEECDCNWAGKKGRFFTIILKSRG